MSKEDKARHLVSLFVNRETAMLSRMMGRFLVFKFWSGTLRLIDIWSFFYSYFTILIWPAVLGLGLGLQSAIACNNIKSTISETKSLGGISPFLTNFQ